MRRKEIEDEIIDLLKQAKSHFKLDDVKDVIYEEDGTDSMQDIVAMFDTGEKGGPELSTILEVITDAWNHFPHRSLGGKAPVEMK